MAHAKELVDEEAEYLLLKPTVKGGSLKRN